MKKSITRIMSLLVVSLLCLTASNVKLANAVTDDIGTLTIVDQEDVTPSTSNKAFVRVESPTKDISGANVCFTTDVTFDTFADGATKITGSIDGNAITLNGLISGGQFMSAPPVIGGLCVIYLKTSGAMILDGVDTDIISFEVPSNNTTAIEFGLNENAYLGDNEDTDVDTTTYSMSINDEPVIKEIRIQVKPGSLQPGGVTTIDGVENMALIYSKDGGAVNVSDVLKDSPVIHFIVEDKTDNKVNYHITNSITQEVLNFTQEDKAFSTTLDNLEYATQYGSGLELNVNYVISASDDQTSGPAVSDLQFSTELDLGRPSDVTDSVMTKETNSSSTIEFSVSTDNSAVEKYYLFERGILAKADPAVLNGNDLDSTELLAQIDTLKIAESTNTKISFDPSNADVQSKLSDADKLGNNQFVVVAMDNATNLNNEPANNFSQINDGASTDTVWYHADREGDFDNDGRNNAKDIVRMVRYYMGAESDLYGETVSGGSIE